MFNYLQKIVLFGLTLGLLASCEKEGDLVTLAPNAGGTLALTSSVNSLTLNRATSTTTALTLKWNEANYGANVPVRYVVQLDKQGGNFAAPQEISVGTSTSLAMSATDLNQRLTLLGVAASATAPVQVRVKSEIVALPDRANVQAVFSAPATLTATTFAPLILTTYLWVPGEYQGWSPDKAARLISPTGDGAHEGYVNFAAASPFKFTSAPNWDNTNYGGVVGKLDTKGENLKIDAPGYYLLKADVNKLTWSATKTQWGIIGAATPKGWDASTPLTYDATTGTWKTDIVLKADLFKFRANDLWDINLGDNKPANGFLSYGGENMVVPAAGTYTVTLNLNDPAKFTYSLTKK